MAEIELTEALQRRALALFIGADLPQEVTGLPSRADLARELVHRHGLDESASLARVAQQVGQGGNRRTFTAFILDQLDTAGRSPQPFHRRVAEMVKGQQVKTIITTAYDDLLEQAFRDASVAFKRVVRGSDVALIDPNRPVLIKLYGDVQQPDTLVVTEDDHLGLWSDRDREAVLNKACTVLQENTTLFLGYDMSDPDFNLLWHRVLDRAGRFARSAYAVWPGLPEADVQMWRGRGITILDADPLGTLSMGYVHGLEILGAQLERTGRYDEFEALRGQLLESLGGESERQAPIAELDRLTRAVLDIGFTDLVLGRVSPRMQRSAKTLSLVQRLSVALTPGQIEPPVQPRLQTLPFDKLKWEQFEALCAALVEANPLTISCNLYGVQGDFQQGIDVVAVQRGPGGDETWVYQCKRHKDYTPGKLAEALDKMTYSADYYVLALGIPATAAMREIADARPNAFLWDAHDIARKLKSYPAIVEDFFGPAWREAFCGVVSSVSPDRPGPPAAVSTFQLPSALSQDPSHPPAGGLSGPLPQISAVPHIKLSRLEKTILQHVHQGCEEVLVEREFGEGLSGARVFLTSPSRDGLVAHKVTKLGPAPELGRERDNYEKYARDFLPAYAARVEGYYEQESQAGLNYIFVGGEALGEVVDLLEYYRTHTAEQVVEMLTALLDQALRPWYDQAVPGSPRLFAAEYSRHMAPHLQLRLRPASSDALRPVGQLPTEAPDYRQIAVEDIPREHEAIQPGALVSVEGLDVVRVKRDTVDLHDPDGQGIFLRVKLPPGSSVAREWGVGSRIGVRGEVVSNRRTRMEDIVRDIFPELATTLGEERVTLPNVPGAYPNPLQIYPDELNQTLRGRASCVHGDLHPHNVLVNVLPGGLGRGWLIDLAKVEKRHNVFDFIALETYLRVWELGCVTPPLSLAEYVHFEEALNAATLGINASSPIEPRLQKAYQVILAIRRIARNYLLRDSDFLDQYFPALFLYCLGMMQYYRNDGHQAARLAFATACALWKAKWRGCGMSLVKLVLNGGIVVVLAVALSALIPFHCKSPLPSALCLSTILLLISHFFWRWCLLNLVFRASAGKSSKAKRSLRQCALWINRWLHPWRLRDRTLLLLSAGISMAAVACFLILPPRLEQPLHVERFSVQFAEGGSRILNQGDELELAPGERVLVEAKLDQDNIDCTWDAVQGELEATGVCVAVYTAPSHGTRDVLSILAHSPCKTRSARADLHIWIVVSEDQ